MRQDTLTQRRLLETLRLIVKGDSSFGVKPEDIRPHTLKVYAKLSSKSDSYTLRLGSNATSVNPCEVLLDKSAVFFANLIGLNFHKVKISGGVEYPALSSPVSFPDPRIFTGAAPAAPAVATEAEALECVSNGLLTMKTDQDIRLDGFAANVFRQVTNTQQGAATIPDMSGLNLVDISTALSIFGDRANEFTIKLPAGSEYAAIGGTATNQNYLVLCLGGFIVVNASNSKRMNDLFNQVYSKYQG